MVCDVSEGTETHRGGKTQAGRAGARETTPRERGGRQPDHRGVTQVRSQLYCDK